MTILDAIKQLGPSVIRTVSPMIVGLIVTGLAATGLDWQPTAEASALATVIVGAAWYALIRVLEEASSTKWGALLGWRGAPTYPEDAEPEQSRRVLP